MEKYLSEYGSLYESKLQLQEQMKEVNSDLKTNLKVIENYMSSNNIPTLPIKVGDKNLTLTLEKKAKLK